VGLDTKTKYAETFPRICTFTKKVFMWEIAGYLKDATSIDYLTCKVNSMQPIIFTGLKEFFNGFLDENYVLIYQ